jgi:hypothetical protein
MQPCVAIGDAYQAELTRIVALASVAAAAMHMFAHMRGFMPCAARPFPWRTHAMCCRCCTSLLLQLLLLTLSRSAAPWRHS